MADILIFILLKVLLFPNVFGIGPCVHFCTSLCNQFAGDFSQVENQLIIDNLTQCSGDEVENQVALTDITTQNPETLGDRTVFEMEFSPQKKR